MKKIILTLSLVLTLSATVLADSPINLWVKGDYVKSDVDPVIVESRTLVPIRVISESLGYKVDWTANDKPVVISKGDETLTIEKDVKKIVHKKSTGENTIEIEVSPQLIGGRFMLPVRAISEAFGEKVDWDEKNRVVVVGEGYSNGISITKSDSEVTIEDLIGVWNGKYTGKDFNGDADIQICKQNVKVDNVETNNYEYFLAIHIQGENNSGKLLKVYSPVYYKNGEFALSGSVLDNKTGVTELVDLNGLKVKYTNSTLEVPTLGLKLTKTK